MDGEKHYIFKEEEFWLGLAYFPLRESSVKLDTSNSDS